eukprot:5820011-Pyramimonas_sp.AAC.1
MPSWGASGSSAFWSLEPSHIDLTEGPRVFVGLTDASFTPLLPPKKCLARLRVSCAGLGVQATFEA